MSVANWQYNEKQFWKLNRVAQELLVEMYRLFEKDRSTSGIIRMAIHVFCQKRCCGHYKYTEHTFAPQKGQLLVNEGLIGGQTIYNYYSKERLKKVRPKTLLKHKFSHKQMRAAEAIIFKGLKYDQVGQ